MKRLKIFILLLIPLILLNVATLTVVTVNQKKGLYPTNADSIGIPIYMTMHVSITIILPIILIICFLPLLPIEKWFSNHRKILTVVSGVFFLIMYAVAGLFSVDGILSWATPNHYVIASSYFLLLLTLVFSFVRDFKRLLSNGSINSDWLTAH